MNLFIIFVSLQKYLINILVYIHCTCAAPPLLYVFLTLTTTYKLFSIKVSPDMRKQSLFK